MRKGSRKEKILDTNVILRYLLKDDNDLYLKAEKIINSVKSGECYLFIPQAVFVEVVFVLQKLYKVPRNEIVNALNFFLFLKGCKVQDKEVIEKALVIYKTTNLSFVDALLCAFKRGRKYLLETFDKDLIKKCTD
ncbi:PIN domain-containing protein [Desulfurobacterium atlanticum]|uniref:Predicted nucleic-acid-binding protein, contains PIN domain n=1 Tax=Desulfurobacterium atlanticum TaxID=240169 RepID=A0A239AEK4_9BACT|nr:PIN domain-containing protein [Desulfurobacterium atlanticum]SNR93791.1 Predicted nucleic-acid-binding protein, contains PIN domain [Desulfurobacterium atlanticum]